MIYILVYFLIILLIFFPYRRENTIRRFILGIYLLSAFVTVIKSIVAPEDFPINPIAILYYTICTIILLFPFIKYGNIDCRKCSFSKQFIDVLSYILIIFGIISWIYTLPRIFTLQTLVNNLSDVRNAYYRGEQLIETSTSTIEILANWVSHIQYISPFLAFYYHIKKNIIKTCLLSICAITPALNNILIGEREAIIVLFSNFIFAYIFWIPYLNKSQIIFLKKIALFLSLPFIIFIITMTFSRFSEYENGVGNSLLVYIGEQPYNFSYFYTYLNIDEQSMDGKLNFGIFFPEEEQAKEPINTYISSSKYLNVFAAIPGSFLLDFAYYAVIICVILATIFVVLIKNKKGRYDFGNVLMYLIYFQIIFMGVFYFDFTRKYSIIMSIIIYLCWKLYSSMRDIINKTLNTKFSLININQ